MRPGSEGGDNGQGDGGGDQDPFEPFHNAIFNGDGGIQGPENALAIARTGKETDLARRKSVAP